MTRVASPFAGHVLFRLGPLSVADAVVVTWGIVVVLAVVAWAGTRSRGRLSVAFEVIVDAVAVQIRQVTRRIPTALVPLVGTLFVFLVAANLSSLLPGVPPPTARIETPAALALIVFASVHVLGVRARGLRRYLASYFQPNPLLLPLNVLAQITRTFSLAIRLFGNVMSHELIVAIALSLAGLLVPVPLLILGALIGIVQAYIFAILATVFIGAGLEGESGEEPRGRT